MIPDDDYNSVTNKPWQKNNYIIFVPADIEEAYKKKRKMLEEKPKHQLDPDKLIWKPPVFTASSRTWN